MMELNEKQVDFILQDIRKKGIKDTKLESEILDHICCAIEAKATCGDSLEKIYFQVIEGFGKNGIQSLQEESSKIFRRKPRHFKQLSLWLASSAACICFFIFFAGDGNAQSRPDSKPVSDSAPISSHFGKRFHPPTADKSDTFHSGIDFQVPVGTPVLATADGIVEKIAFDVKRQGNYILLRHKESYQTLYTHLQGFAVKAGQKVKKGKVIAYSGNTGKSSGPHLHYEIIKEGKTVNPETYFK